MLMQWLDLILLILKIAVLSTVYTSLVLLVVYAIARKTQSPWLRNRMTHKFRNWLFLHFLISICLFLYAFSYQQDTGLGENPSIPIGYGQRIYSPDFAWTDFYPDLSKTELNKDELQIENFIIKNNMLCAEVSHQQTNRPDFDFIVCDLPSRTNKTFRTKTEYEDYARKNGLPMTSEFYDSQTHYKEYFARQSKWKKWLLP